MGSIAITDPLFESVRLGALTLKHRVILAPLTRMRAGKESEGVYVPSELNVEYYSQRASEGGLMLTEATPISRHAAGYPGVPGIFTSSQIAGWKKVTDAVHTKGGYIYCQLWHVGRATVSSLIEGKEVLGASEIPLAGNALDGSEYAASPPRAMTVEEIQDTVKEFAAAAKRARDAGFDGVEVHGANGYLLDQFLHDNVNTRTDEYGGSIEKRSRIILEVLKAVSAEIGANRVGIRLSPYNYFQDTRDSNPNENWLSLCSQIAGLSEESRPAYVHMVEPRFDEVMDEAAKIESLPSDKPSLDVFRPILKKSGISLLAAGSFNAENAGPKLATGGADAVVFGRYFISNPDLPRRLKEGLPLTPYDRTTFYGADPVEKGYTDYTFYGK
ncbi:12-oxophytodienoate reductase opr, putative [Penicillium digitatum]|uniref:12-oxophytodienoate reductase opr, putative n=3 Tax=Penicillium digitatum TaxID=36651 RepID=K9G654_PEND2|nr:12-oxophytodienoate reductase opr, putative [Penicillium digitatum Pd1]EKV11627.1 12-oxophytodienoate reductase opr, putative [Penicillium digitatum Pd1]EKV16874.1 12-oxophytodienoate reductase opr, putative [Penicillium digitatum PHI26]QQK43750.1 12-oxophytodienoate reductase opr, putative [Penicillium digitatum]